MTSAAITRAVDGDSPPGPQPPPAPSAAPSAAARPRSDLADILRGVALMGICLVNLPFIALPLLGDDWPMLGPTDIASNTIGALLFQAKFFPIFSLLFGYGFAVLLGRMESGIITVWAYRRRLAALLLLGALHAVLLFPGDILMIYALTGLILWRLRNAPDRTLLQVALWVNLIAGALMGLIMMVMPLRHATEWTPAMEAARTAYLGGFGEALAQRLEELPTSIVALIFAQGPLVVGAFALGLSAGRRGLLSDPAALLAVLRTRFRWLVPLAVIGNGLYAAEFWLPDMAASLAMGIMPVAGLALAALYVAGVAALVQARPDLPGLSLLRRAGGMSLSNYLGQSLVANALFLGWGLGLYGQFDRLGLIPISLGIAGGLILLSVLWLRWFCIGPMEWLLRCWTELRVVPLRRTGGTAG
ncbi:MAG: hypothetical protein RLY86_1549 [Pseudomonadota bacterium]|jgi:uncharacterized protein